MTVVVKQSAGDTYRVGDDSNESHYLPYPLDYATFYEGGDRRDVFILGKSVLRGTSVGVHPFVELLYAEPSGDTATVFVAYPSDEQLSTGMSPSEKLNSDKLYSILHIIDYWYTHKDGLNGRHQIKKREVTHLDYQVN